MEATACEPTVVLPVGLGRVRVRLDPDSSLRADSMTIDPLVSEVGCASGREMGRALRGPQVVETDTSVLIAFAVVAPIAGCWTIVARRDQRSPVGG